jgi:hypothetical protein
MNFLFDEDEALRNLLLGMSVMDQKANSEGGSTRSVKVYFGQPDQELRDQTYPYITIDMIDIAEDVERAHRGKVKPAYYTNPTNMVDAAQGVQQVAWNPELNDWDVDYPVPVNIDYQITTYARQPRHDRQILAQLLTSKIPLRFAVLSTGPNTVSGTTRRLDVLDVSKRDVTEQGKRLFVNAITVRISSEIVPSLIHKFYKVQEVDVTGTTGLNNQFTAVEPPITITAP